MTEWVLDKSRLKDDKGRYITQGLFLEERYNVNLAVYTYDGEDKTYNGKLFPSLRKLYLEFGDVTEYNFANKYLYDWNHWKRICANKVLSRHVDEWREELELSLRADGIQTIIDAAVNDNSYQAGKYLADKGWIEKSRGRPSKEEIEREKKHIAQVEKEYEDDFKLLEFNK